MGLTTNYSLDKSKWGHQVVDDDIDRHAANLDIIDTELYAVQKGVVTYGPIDITGTTVWKLEFPFKVTINKFKTVVTEEITTTGTVTVKNHAGTSMTNGTVTLTDGDSIGEVETASPTVNNVIDTGEDLQFVSNGACAAGQVICIAHYTRTA